MASKKKGLWGSIVASLGVWLDSKKTKAMLSGMVASLISTYFLKDSPDLALKIATLFIGGASTLVLAQGGADAFGSEAYHSKKK